jgi:F-type H+-transporting ATPase subunit b
MSEEMLNDPMFFYTIAFVIFVALAYKFGRKGILGWIDGEIAKVRSQLDEAQKLRAEAEATLAEYKENQEVAVAEAKQLVKNAKEEAVRLKAQAEADLKASLARHEQQATERIRMAEAEALVQVRVRAVDLAMNLARKTLGDKLQGDAAAKLVDQAIADLPTAGGDKAKAA